MGSLNKWKIEKVSLKKMMPFDENPRAITEKAEKGLRASIERFGYVEPIVWNKTTGNIVGGHQRYSELVRQGVEEATVVVVELSSEKELAANLTLNNPEIEGEWDEPALELLEQVKDSNEELFDSLNLGDLRESIESMGPADAGGDDDEDEEEHDTKCPCCKHEWNIVASDVSV